MARLQPKLIGFGSCSIRPNAKRRSQFHRFVVSLMRTSGARRVDFLRVHCQLLHGLLGLLDVELAVASQAGERGCGDGFGVDLEVTAEVLPVVAAAEAVSAKRDQARSQPRSQLIGHRLDVVGGGDRAFGPGQRGYHVRLAGLFRGMQTIPAFGFQPVAAEFVVAGDAPHVSLHAVLVGENALRAQSFIQDRPAAKKLDRGLAGRRVFAFVEAAHDAFFTTLWHLRHGVVFVVQHDVVEAVFALLVHAAQAVLHDHGDLVDVRRIVGRARRHDAGEHDAVAVLVLQAFAQQSSAAGGSAHQEALAAGIGERPDQVSDALEAEHGVVGEEGNHGHTVVGVRCARRRKRRHGAGFSDAFFQNLTVAFLAIIEKHVLIVRSVELALAGVDADLADDGLHAESARFVGDDGHHQLAEVGILHHVAQHADEAHGGGDCASLGAGQRLIEEIERRSGELGCLGIARGQVAAKLAATLLKVAHLGSVVSRLVERSIFRGALRNGNIEALAESRHGFVGHLLFLVSGIAGLGRAQAVALDSFGQDDGGPAHVLHGALVGVVDLLRIEAAALQLEDLVVGHVGDQLQRFRIFAEEVLAHKGAIFGLEGLVFAVDALFHALDQHAGVVAGQKRVPAGAPDDLDHVPLGAAEGGFQLVDDLAVAAHRAVKPLQVAVDDEDEIVEFLARGQRELRTHGFGLVGLAVADEGPDFARSFRNDSAVLQVAHEARLVNRVERAQAHGDRWETPEVWHQPGMRIGAQAGLVAQFVAKVFQLLLGEASFEKSAGVNARRSVALEVNEVTGLFAVLGMKEVIEADFEQRGEGGKSRYVSADPGVFFVLAMDHSHRVPANQALDAPFQRAVSGIRNFLGDRNGVYIGRIELDGTVDSGSTSALSERIQEAGRSTGALLVDYLVKRFNPFFDFLEVGFQRRRRLAIYKSCRHTTSMRQPWPHANFAFAKDYALVTRKTTRMNIVQPAPARRESGESSAGRRRKRSFSALSTARTSSQANLAASPSFHFSDHNAFC